MVLEAPVPPPWGHPLQLGSQRTALTSLANVWLAEGAVAVTVSIDGIPAITLTADKRASGAVRPDVRAAAGRPAELAAPVYWDGQLVGEIRIVGALDEAAQARVAAEAELVGLLLATEADLASMTDQLIETQDQLLAVYDLGQLARQPMRLAERLLALTESAARLLNVEGTAIVLASDGRGPVAAQYPQGAQDEAWLLSLLRYLPVVKAPAADGLAGEPLVLWQGEGRPGLPDGVSSVLLAPIGDPAGPGGQAPGAFVFWSERHERFASPEMKLAAAIAEHGSVQIENAVLQRDRIAQARLETEMQLARRVQMDLLPKALPKMPGLDVYAYTRPASHVGGDFFDFVASSGDRTVFLVSDVSGKGMSAALVMAMTRTILRSAVGHARARYAGAVSPAAMVADASRQAGSAGQKWAGPAVAGIAVPEAEVLPTPATLLAAVNDELFHDLTELSMFATAFVAQYDHRSRRLTYSNAGHSPVIYKPVGEPAELVEACCPPIGVLPGLRYSDHTLTMRPGDVLVAASDGFNESRNAAGEMFGLARMLDCVEDGADLSAEAIGQMLFATVEMFRDGEMQEDDQTLIIAKGA